MINKITIHLITIYFLHKIYLPIIKFLIVSYLNIFHNIKIGSKFIYIKFENHKTANIQVSQIKEFNIDWDGKILFDVTLIFSVHYNESYSKGYYSLSDILAIKDSQKWINIKLKDYDYTLPEHLN